MSPKRVSGDTLVAVPMRVLFPLPHADFDPTEAAIPWKALVEAGHEVVFATPDGEPAVGDPRVLSGRGFGPWRPFLRATEHARRTYDEMLASDAFRHPVAFDALDPAAFDAVHLTGGHAPGMRAYLESAKVQDLVGAYLAQGKPVAAICHGVLVVARAKDPATGRPALEGRKTTALLRTQELTGWALTGLWLGSYYRTYPETVEAEVIGSLSSPNDFIHGPFSIRREGPHRPDAGFCVRDGNYLSARFYGDAYRYARELVEMLARPWPAPPPGAIVPAVSEHDGGPDRETKDDGEAAPKKNEPESAMLGASTWPRRDSLAGSVTLSDGRMMVDRYQIKRQLGSGGSSVVFEAFDPHMERTVALKLVDVSPIPGHDATNPVMRSVREAQALAQISHPNVVRVYEVAHEENTVRIVMELVDGQTLREWMQAEAQRPWREIIRILVQAARGLSAAHKGGLVHRDFKPDNVLVTRTGDVRVLDFGLARAEAREVVDALLPSPSEKQTLRADVTQSGAILGTPAYMAPEQFRGEAAGARGDQFAFCLVLYEALYRRRAFAGNKYDEIEKAVTTGEPLPPPEDAEVPEYIWPVLRRGLSREPDERWASMDELLAELKKDPGNGELPAWWTW